jgi:5'(3')-deoxyribonucleotidase
MAQRPKTIAIDVDDVLAAGAEGFVQFSNGHWGTQLTVDDYNERWGIMWGVDKDEEEKRAKIIYASSIVKDFQPKEEAVKTLKHLAQSYKLVVLTSRAQPSQSDTLLWLEQNFAGIFSDIHFSGFYDGLPEHAHKQTKADLCKAIGADFLIDDQIKHCFAAANAGIDSLLFGNYAWNREALLPSRVWRVNNWPSVREHFDGLA